MTPVRTYLDHNATTPLRPAACAAMLAAMDEFGNASSVHAEGRRARGIVETAREQVAALVGARPSEVVFTSGASESNAWVMTAGWDRIVVASHEHASVFEPARATNAAVSEISVASNGVAEIAAISDALRRREGGKHTLVSLQMANGETGAVQPVAELALLARENGAIMHTDAVQAVGRISVAFTDLGCDLMSVSAHKIGGPKGVGALVIRDGIDLRPLILGGGQERRRRSGTEPVMLIAGFGAAAVEAQQALGAWAAIDRMRRELEDGIRRLTPAAIILAEGAPRLPNTTSVALPGEQAATLLIRLDLAGIAVSAGSACSSGRIGKSHVLSAMHVPADLAAAAIRISLGWSTTPADVATFLDAWARIAARPASAIETPAPAGTAMADRAGAMN
jgi:cysteine desulfurase